MYVHAYMSMHHQLNCEQPYKLIHVPMEYICYSKSLQLSYNSAVLAVIASGKFCLDSKYKQDQSRLFYGSKTIEYQNCKLEGEVKKRGGKKPTLQEDSCKPFPLLPGRLLCNHTETNSCSSSLGASLSYFISKFYQYFSP